LRNCEKRQKIIGHSKGCLGNYVEIGNKRCDLRTLSPMHNNKLEELKKNLGGSGLAGTARTGEQPLLDRLSSYVLKRAFV
jgi:hypothetical protein